ncbi:MAG: NAD(P)-dependent oxidoreductase [Lamprobacter sp.]|uniref:NAD(P)-dependent oxidoreductase n=1 Tax=Lamprobacter sp. TaxID=3100796 RepID=UPI002B258574|nr:NAD(P)-dependent oxidoreductase [Lamprobacter sp.]MEA3643206.1 NAD(P)-dependent oxidoreductase [Lamprobacter sp.]
MKRTILMIGAGQLGSRYLQGLATVVNPLSITVVEPSVNAQAITLARWEDVGGAKSGHELAWTLTLPNHLDSVDIAIIATAARDRGVLVKKISRQVKVRYWLLEKVLVQKPNDLEVLSHAVSASSGCWVNTPRRLMPWYQRLKAEFEKHTPISVIQDGELWGLACNSIHFIDLIAWWTGESLAKIETERLDPTWFESKRPGYYEITGELIAHYSGGSTLYLRSRREQADFKMQISSSTGASWIIDQTAGTAIGPSGQRLDGQMLLQSEMTAPLITSLLAHGTCGLPTLQESAQMHGILLEALLTHWQRYQNPNEQLVPIT